MTCALMACGSDGPKPLTKADVAADVAVDAPEKPRATAIRSSDDRTVHVVRRTIFLREFCQL
jgi:predicted small lipoprotein YifL